MSEKRQIRADQVEPGTEVMVSYVTHGGLHRAEPSYYEGTERVTVVRWESAGDGTAWLIGQFGHKSGPYPRDYRFRTP